MVENLTRTSAQLFMQNEQRIPISKNHSDLVKFHTKADAAYQSVVTHLSRHIQKIKAGK
jgi:hypothetical protein